MKILDRFFLWCSDTDMQTLEAVNVLDRKSKRYQINYGRLLLIPAVMAGAGTAHAVSDFVPQPPIYTIVGVIVGWFIFTIDRAIVASYEKKEKGIGRQFWFRLILSVITGFIIALFLIFFFFQNRIYGQIQENIMHKSVLINSLYDAQRDSVNAKLEEKEKYVNFYRTVTQAELDGVRKTFQYKDLPSITTTGKSGRGISTQTKEQTLKKLEDELGSLKTSIQPRLNEIDSCRKVELNLNEENMNKQDPLIKLEMLVEIMSQHPMLLIIILPFYFFLLSLDLIPLLIKELAQTTKYDNLYRNRELSKINLNFADYNKKTQEYFDRLYRYDNDVGKKVEEVDYPIQKNDSCRSFLKRFKWHDFKQFKWYNLLISGIILGLIVWLYQFYFGIEMSDISKLLFSILLAIITDSLKQVFRFLIKGCNLFV